MADEKKDLQTEEKEQNNSNPLLEGLEAKKAETNDKEEESDKPRLSQIDQSNKKETKTAEQTTETTPEEIESKQENTTEESKAEEVSKDIEANEDGQEAEKEQDKDDAGEEKEDKEGAETEIKAETTSPSLAENLVATPQPDAQELRQNHLEEKIEEFIDEELAQTRKPDYFKFIMLLFAVLLVVLWLLLSGAFVYQKFVV